MAIVKFNADKRASIGTITKQNAVSKLSKSSRGSSKEEFEHFLKLAFVDEKNLWDRSEYNFFEDWARDNDLIPFGRTYSFMKTIVLTFSMKAYIELGPRLLTKIHTKINEEKIPKLFKDKIDIILKTNTATFNRISPEVRRELNVAVDDFAKKHCKTKVKAYEDLRSKSRVVIQAKYIVRLEVRGKKLLEKLKTKDTEIKVLKTSSRI